LKVYSAKKKNGKLKLITFFFRKLIPAKLNYEIYDKELFAIVAYFKEWRVFLKEVPAQVTMFINYKNLIIFTTTKAFNKK